MTHFMEQIIQEYVPNLFSSDPTPEPLAKKHLKALPSPPTPLIGPQ